MRWGVAAEGTQVEVAGEEGLVGWAAGTGQEAGMVLAVAKVLAMAVGEVTAAGWVTEAGRNRKCAGTAPLLEPTKSTHPPHPRTHCCLNPGSLAPTTAPHPPSAPCGANHRQGGWAVHRATLTATARAEPQAAAYVLMCAERPSRRAHSLGNLSSVQ